MRAMCHVELIEEIKPIENSDNLAHYRVLGWWAVDRKDRYKIGDKVIAFEVDSILPPIPYFSFMESKKMRVKTCKLRGALSEILLAPFDDRLVIFQQLIEKEQGVAVPIERLGITKREFAIGDDLTEILKIKKQEDMITCCQSGQQKGSFPSGIRRTDEPRIEGSDGRKLYNELLGKPYYITVKLDGTSGTYFIRGCGTGYEFGVCSRNNEYRYDSTKPNFYWYACKKQEVEEWMAVVHAATGHDWCIQGEVCGPKIQENKLGLIEPTLFVFNITNLTENRRLGWKEMESMLGLYPAKFELVPLYCAGDSFDFKIEDLYEMADGYYSSSKRREGIVIRHANGIQSQTVYGEPLSFKVISKKFLLGEK